MLKQRKNSLLNYLNKHGEATATELLAYLSESGTTVSKPTLARDLQRLIKEKEIKSVGKGPGTKYQPIGQNIFLQNIDIDRYFENETDRRDARRDFNWHFFTDYNQAFSGFETKQLTELNDRQKNKINGMTPAERQKEFERITVELSWRSSHLEGNTYSLLDTEALIKERTEAPGHPHAEAIMILNHKKALDYILANSKKFRSITPAMIREIHALFAKDLKIVGGFRAGQVGIIGTAYRPIDNTHQIQEALEKACALINRAEFPLEKCLLAVLLVSYIQPFVDGNKRTARIIGNAMLLAYDWCPLSYRSVDEIAYKKALILFYEQNNLRHFKNIISEQFAFAVNNYF